MPNPKNGRVTPKKRKEKTEPQPQGIPFDSDVLVPDEVIAQSRMEAQMAQKDAQIAGLNAQLLETRNELIRAKMVIDQFAEEKNGKKGKSSNGNEDGKVRQTGGRGKAVKSKKG